MDDEPVFDPESGRYIMPDTPEPESDIPRVHGDVPPATRPLDPNKLNDGTIPPHHLPKWFALRGPEPYSLVSNLSLTLSVLSIVALMLNMILTQKLLPANWYNEITTIIAWISSIALLIQSRSSRISAIAEWRAEVRAKEGKNDAH
jgi:hypothetical protein